MFKKIKFICLKKYSWLFKRKLHQKIPSYFLSQITSDTYMVKLFERSVDLAQFPEDTPLYPVCRAWMQNDPQIPSNNHHSRRYHGDKKNKIQVVVMSHWLNIENKFH